MKHLKHFLPVSCCRLAFCKNKVKHLETVQKDDVKTHK